MNKTDEYEPPKGYDIQHWHNPEEYRVYREATYCKCCGQVKNNGLMESIHIAKTQHEAREWLDKHVGRCREGAECEERSKWCE